MNIAPMWWVVGAAAIVLVATVVMWRLGKPGRLPVVRVVVACLVLLLGLRPSVGDRPPITDSALGADVVLMIDRTASMGAQDYDDGQSRIVGVAHDVNELTANLRGSRFAVIAIDNDARVEVPFTTDATAVSSYASAIGWRESSRGSGTDVSVGVDLAREVLESSASERPDAQRLFVYLGDGEQTIEDDPQSFEPLRQYLDDALVLGYGTKQGAKIPTYPGSLTWVEYQGEPAISHADPATLQAIAEQTSGTYQQRGTGELPELAVTGHVELPDTPDEGRVELYWIIGLAVAALLCVELWRAVTAYRTTRKELP